MNPDGPARRRGGFLASLLRRGAPALATATTELPDEVADPAPMRALRRMQHMAAGAADGAFQDTLLLRAARYVALVPLAYRLVAVPGAFAAFAARGGGGTRALVVVGAVAALSFALNAGGAWWLLRRAPFRDRAAGRLLALDVAFTLAANLAVAAAVPAEVFAAATEVTSKHLLGAVALLTLAVGLPAGAALALASIPLGAGMAWASGGGFDLTAGFAVLGTVLGVLLTATGALVLLGLGTRLALAYGIRTGRLAERAVQHRRLHDTVLQALEAMALPDSGDADTLRRTARAEATALRRYLESDSGAEGGPLAEKLAALAAEMARDGLRAQLVAAELDDATLSEVRQLAVRDAVREALRNTLKHSGTDTAVVRVEERDGGIATIIRDHGTGFSPGERKAGFGISESITARLAEVGGTATVESTPGSGTRVTLWVPR
ncbi:sensor histidine kinase [Prauserella muralis]|uniref:Histidine kinase n=1 Tax=Prauserella muralis TaxID=588067 RepID=A0A2V4B9D7_9PSEU|nr:ATP-binding protein [Prauserella muralis]PXY31651.1 histidine kinase [Prauserella muralis]TWE13975.1 signal transduction histidine kinase [Prauserella muralis]